MSDPTQQLYLSGGGSTTIATDEMLAAAQQLDGAAAGLGALLVQLRTAQAVVSGAVLAVPHAADAQTEVELARTEAQTCCDLAEYVAQALHRAIDHYSETEHNNEAVALAVNAVLTFVLGKSVAVEQSILGPFKDLLALWFPWLVRGTFEGDDKKIGATDVSVPAWLNESMNDPAVIAMLRRSITNGDALVFGLGDVPAMLQDQLANAGVTGVAATSTLLMLYAGLAGMLTETGVTVTKTAWAERTGPPTTGYQQHIGAIPDSADRVDGAQIRIDEIHDGDAVRYEVFIGGTADFNPIAQTEAFDMTANMAGVAGQSPASYRAVQLAMEQMGITASTPVSFTGYSQGGLIATMLASNGQYNTQGLLTIGAPAGQIAVPGGFPAVIIEHYEDLVPALGGTQLNTEALVVQRQAFSPQHPADPTLPVAGHQFQYYLETTGLMDEGDSAQLTEAAAQLDAFSSGDSVTSSWFHAERTP